MRTTHEGFNLAVQRFYCRFIGALGQDHQRLAMSDRFLTELLHWPAHSKVLEIGAGDGGLALYLLRRYPITHYVAVEPAAGMVEAMPAELLRDRRFLLFLAGFEKWPVIQDQFDRVISRYVLHDFPKQVGDWYVKIGLSLKPGGVLVVLDAARAADPSQTAANLQELIDIAQQIPCYSPEEERAQRQFIDHLQAELPLYLSVDQHMELIRAAGLQPELLKQYGNSYVLRATKPLGPE